MICVDGIVGFFQLEQFDVHLIKYLPFTATLSFTKGAIFLLNRNAFDLFTFFYDLFTD